MRVERSVEMRGRIRGRQTLAMPMLHSTTIQTPAGTRVPGFCQQRVLSGAQLQGCSHEASVCRSSASSGIRTTQEIHTLWKPLVIGNNCGKSTHKQPSMKMPIRASFFVRSRRRLQSHGMGNTSMRILVNSSVPVTPHERVCSLTQSSMSALFQKLSIGRQLKRMANMKPIHQAIKIHPVMIATMVKRLTGNMRW